MIRRAARKPASSSSRRSIEWGSHPLLVRELLQKGWDLKHEIEYSCMRLLHVRYQGSLV